MFDTSYGFYTPGKTPHKVVSGVLVLIVEALMQRKKALLRPNTYREGQGITYDPATLKAVWEQLAVTSGVRILYNTLVVDGLLVGRCLSAEHDAHESVHSMG